MLVSQGIAHKSIKAYLSAAQHMQVSALGFDPNISSMLSLQYVLQGIKRVQAMTGSNNSCPHLPITSSTMRLLK